MSRKQGRKRAQKEGWVKSGNKSKVTLIIRGIVFLVSVIGWFFFIWHLLRNWLRF